MASFLEDVISGHENAMYGETGTSGLYHNSPTQTNYNINATSDLANRISQGVGSIPMAGPYLGGMTDLAMPALALGTSPFYDTSQAIGKAKEKYGSSYGMVDDTEIPGGPTMSQLGTELNNQNILSSMLERSLGAATPLASKLSFNAPNFDFMGSAQASELTDLERDFPGMSTGDIIDSMNARQSANRFSGMGQVGPNKSNMNAPAALDMDRFAGVSNLGRNDMDVEQVEQLGSPSRFQGLQDKIGTGFNNVKDFAMDKGTQGFNLAKQIPGMALSAMTGIPGIGMALGLLGKMGSNEYAQATTANMQKQNNNLQGLGLDGVSNFGGVTTDDLGRITNNGLNYNTPEGIMSGYNSGFDLASAALGRIGKIQDGLALGKFKNVNKANQKINNLKTAAVASAQAKRQAYQDKIDRAKNEAAANRARAKSITAGYGGHDDRPGATGPTATGAGMGVGGGYNTDYQGEKDGGMIGYKNGGVASMFTRRG